MVPGNISRNLLRCAIVYGLLSASLLAVMSIQKNFASSGFYLHISLLGWVAMMLMALTYRLFPALTECPWAKVQFWTHNIGLPVLLVGIYSVSRQMPLGTSCTIAGSVLIVLAFIAFTINAWRNAN